jgi:hypothetical protein
MCQKETNGTAAKFIVTRIPTSVDLIDSVNLFPQADGDRLYPAFVASIGISEDISSNVYA